jgi:hypothetical protein
MKTTDWMVKVWNLLMKLYDERNGKFGVAVLILASSGCVFITYSIAKTSNTDKVDNKAVVRFKDSIIQSQRQELKDCEQGRRNDIKTLDSMHVAIYKDFIDYYYKQKKNEIQ